MSKLTWCPALLFAAALTAAISPAAIGQPAPSMNYTSFEATPDKPVQLGYYAAAGKDCAPAPVPTIRVSEPPKSGVLTVRVGQLTTSAIAACPGLKLPAQVVFYQARAGATGADHLVYDVIDAPNKIDAYDVTITIREAPKGAGPGSEKPI